MNPPDIASNDKPPFADPLHVGRPNIGDEEVFIRRIREMFRRRWLSNDGPLVKEFEQRIAQVIGVKHCVAVCNATVAMEIAIRANGLRGEVIVPSFTFIATAHALQWQGITPVFCDIDPVTHCLDPLKLEQRITSRTTGVIGVHVWGRACDTEAIEAIARRRGVKVLYDAAHAFGCSHRGRMIGGFGACEVFSFHATKFLNSFEGGAIVTDNDALAEQLKLMRNFGFAGYDNVVSVGTNGKMTEASAAMGLTNLESMDAFIAVNRRNYEAYREGLSGLPGLSMVAYDEAARNNFQYVVVEVDVGRAGIGRDPLLRTLHAANVLARRYFYPGCHRMEPYRTDDPHAGSLLPETEALCDRVLVLPTGTGVSLREVSAVCALLREASGRAHPGSARKGL